MKYQESLIRPLVMVLFFLISTGCQENKTNKSDADAQPATLAEEYVQRYCKNVTKIRLRTNIDEEISLLCQANRPTQVLNEFRTQAINQAEGEIKLVTFKEEHDEAAETTDLFLGWAFHLPYRPFDVKSQPLYEYLTPGHDKDGIKLDAVVVSQNTEESRDGGLHLVSTKMNYHLEVATTVGTPSIHYRNTEFNIYQVLSGDEEMGLAVEHLTDAENEDYSKSLMVSASFNDGEDGAIVITMLHLILDNKGFPITSAEAFQTLGGAMSQLMYKGLTEE